MADGRVQLRPDAMTARRRRRTVEMAWGSIGEDMLEILRDGRNQRTNDGRTSVDVFAACRMLMRRAVQRDAREDDEDLLWWLGVIVAASLLSHTATEGHVRLAPP